VTMHMPTEARNTEIRRLAFDAGVAVPEIAKKYRITESRVSQILDVTTSRQRIWAFLTSHPTSSFTAREIAVALSMDINRVNFYIDSLRKKGAVAADRPPSSGKAGGDHKMWINVQLKRKPRAKDISSVAEEQPAPEPVEQPAPEPASAEEPAVIEEVKAEKLNGGAPPAPWIRGNIGGWPALRDIRDRARVARKREQAAKLLEETGDDELALQLMEKSSFTELEEEVIHLLKMFGELPQ
jgi:hypothetical protein